VLGAAAKGAKDLDRATAAFEKALEVEPGHPANLYNMGAIAAVNAMSILRDAGRVRDPRMARGASVDHDSPAHRPIPRVHDACRMLESGCATVCSISPPASAATRR
jgi:hypothetical protein